MQLRCVLAVLFLIASVEASSAVDLPQFDIRLHCASIVGTADGPTACERMEETARSALISKWATYPEQRKHFCVQSESFLAKSRRSYDNLGMCLGESHPVS
jgi:hypothetical protein